MIGDAGERRDDVGSAGTSGVSGEQPPTESGQPIRPQGRTPVDLNIGGSETHQRPSFSDPIPPGDPDGVAGGREVPGREADTES